MADINEEISNWHKEGTHTPALLQRHPTQIEIFQSDYALVALCNDGSIWGISLKNVGAEWHQLPAIPQPEHPTGPAEGQNYPEPDEKTCPVQFIGFWQHMGEATPYAYRFIDAAGNERNLAYRLLTNRQDLISLFGGTDTWLKENFPKVATITKIIDLKPHAVKAVVDFRLSDAAQWLRKQCLKASCAPEQASEGQ
ncbi:hypothetical protein NKW53_05940 [Acetobacter orientalis]|uniref:hypothetical protein n=1 Tax=Acetobacter orientalis TaxID=146474 RepID=UPI0020A1553B|nr:hypothetical protein [Acetobacter orientalis]MCP1215607.1 hypothetical protein [Acetobacter orientalis]MCP1217540.1 hypothetical protein [Acetobacter orientalis]